MWLSFTQRLSFCPRHSTNSVLAALDANLFSKRLIALFCWSHSLFACKIVSYSMPPRWDFAHCCSVLCQQQLLSDLLDMRYCLTHRCIFTAATAKSIRVHKSRIWPLNFLSTFEGQSYWWMFLFYWRLAQPPKLYRSTKPSPCFQLGHFLSWSISPALEVTSVFPQHVSLFQGE